MEHIEPSAVLKLIDAYESISRTQLIQNLYCIFADKGISRESVYHWLAGFLGTTRNTTYSWFAPNRDAKIPLKVLLRISICLNIPIIEMLDSTQYHDAVPIRRNDKRPSYEDAVAEYYRDHPGAGAREIAGALGIAIGTARRHLLHLEAKSKETKENHNE